MSNNALTRFLGGAPVAVLIRLLFVSLIVGALMMWLDITPESVFRGMHRFVLRLWNLGFDAIQEVLRYLLAGAAVVLPVWLVIRLLTMRNPR